MVFEKHSLVFHFLLNAAQNHRTVSRISVALESGSLSDCSRLELGNAINKVERQLKIHVRYALVKGGRGVGFVYPARESIYAKHRKSPDQTQ